MHATLSTGSGLVENSERERSDAVEWAERELGEVLHKAGNVVTALMIEPDAEKERMAWCRILELCCRHFGIPTGTADELYRDYTFTDGF